MASLCACCSVQGFGRKGDDDAYIYPGSGATADSTLPAFPPTPSESDVANGELAKLANGSTADIDHPDDEFRSTGEEAAPAKDGPRIINVGIGGPGESVRPQSCAEVHAACAWWGMLLARLLLGVAGFAGLECLGITTAAALCCTGSLHAGKHLAAIMQNNISYASHLMPAAGQAWRHRNGVGRGATRSCRL